MQTPESMPTPEGFPPVDRSTWRERVERELRGADFVRELVSHSEDGQSIQPLYGPADDRSGGLPDRGSPGQSPWVRGTTRGVRVASRLESGDHGQLAQRIERELQGGATAIQWRIDLNTRLGLPQGTTPAPHSAEAEGPSLPGTAELAKLLGTRSGSPSDPAQSIAPTWLFDCGGNGHAFSARILAALEGSPGEAEDSPAPEVHLGADPWGAFLRDGSIPAPLDGIRAELRAWIPEVLRRAPTLRCLTFGLDDVHNAGATAGMELGWALASWAECARALEGIDDPLGTLARCVSLRMALGGETLDGIAKLRALRGLTARFFMACGLETCPEPFVHVVGSRRVQSRFDPKTNLLRSTTEAFAALCGGADVVSTLPFADPGDPDAELARRMARNTALVLLEEGALSRVEDPAGGSHALEQRTLDLERAGWSSFQAIESAGGLGRWIEDGHLDRQLDEVLARRAASIAKGERPILGVTVYPRPEEALALPPHGAAGSTPDRGHEAQEPAAPPACPDFPTALERARTGQDILALAPLRGDPPCRPPRGPRRDAEAFEQLRAEVACRSPRPRVFLACLGPLAKHNARAQFAADAFTVGGFELRRGTGVQGDAGPGAVLEDWKGAPADWVCICGDDESLREQVPELARGLRDHGCPIIVVAGKPKGTEPTPWRELGIHGELTRGTDLLGFFRDLLRLQQDLPTPSEVTP